VQECKTGFFGCHNLLSVFERFVRLGTGTRLPFQGIIFATVPGPVAAFEADPFEEPSLEGLRPVLTASIGREVFVA
jgi:hypothetical protein